MKTKILLFISLAWLVVSCGEEGTQTIKIGGLYAIDVPASMDKTTELNEQASLQYQNTIDELYIIVIDESKSQLDLALEQNSLYDQYTSDLDGYSRLITDNMKSALSSNDSIPQPKTMKINGLEAKLFSFEGTTSGVDIFWELAFVEGNNRYYQIMAWTLAEDRDEHDAKMMAMLNSFRETDKSVKQ